MLKNYIYCCRKNLETHLTKSFYELSAFKPKQKIEQSGISLELWPIGHSGISAMRKWRNLTTDQAYGFRDREHFKLKIYQLPEISSEKSIWTSVTNRRRNKKPPELYSDGTWFQKWYRRWNLNPHSRGEPDFESSASAIPPLRQHKKW